MHLKALFLVFVLAASQGGQHKMLRYVALGDSYTIGTGAPPAAAWPKVLTNHLNAAGLSVQLAANPARNGYTTENLIKLELPVLDTLQADFVTVLIGVNDWVRGVDKKTYRQNLIFILDAVQQKISNQKNILLVTIPDFGLTPQGQAYSKGRNISKGISEFNAIIRAEARKRGLPCADIFPISKDAGTDPSLVADDGLHPSAKGYAAWEKIIFAAAVKLLAGK
jgi:acyl-CoA thioesterase I